MVPNEVVIMWQLSRHRILQDRYRNLEVGAVVAIEHDWVSTFAL